MGEILKEFNKLKAKKKLMESIKTTIETKDLTDSGNEKMKAEVKRIFLEVFRLGVNFRRGSIAINTSLIDKAVDKIVDMFNK